MKFDRDKVYIEKECNNLILLHNIHKKYIKLIKESIMCTTNSLVFHITDVLATFFLAGRLTKPPVLEIADSSIKRAA